jgi:hypothetical protein
MINQKVQIHGAVTTLLSKVAGQLANLSEKAWQYPDNEISPDIALAYFAQFNTRYRFQFYCI